MKYLAVLGRQPDISIAELETQTGVKWHQIASSTPLALASVGAEIDIRRFGGCIKLAVELSEAPLDYFHETPEGKLTIGVSDYSAKASRKTAQAEALKLKKILVRHGKSVRVVANKDAVLSTAASLHNGLSGKNPRKVELIKLGNQWYRIVGVQDIDAYTKRDQARPARDAKVGMLPPKLAQILINLCGPLPIGSTILDPFCGTGVVLQEALLMGYHAYGTDLSERMVEYSQKNLKWLGAFSATAIKADSYLVEPGDATAHRWQLPIDAVACEGYLGQPMSQIPSEMILKEQKQECSTIVTGFLKNLVGQIEPGTPVVIAVPAWRRNDGGYARLGMLDYIEDMGYNVNNKSREGLLYARSNQIVARDILILRKK